MRIIYWLTTGLTAAAMVVGGIFDILLPPEAAAALEALGYPAYFGPMLGVWKVLGGAALLAPGLPRVKEWAYAGITFDLIGASFSHGAVGDSIDKIIIPLVILALNLISYATRPASRRLPSARAQVTEASGTPTAAN